MKSHWPFRGALAVLLFVVPLAAQAQATKSETPKVAVFRLSGEVTEAPVDDTFLFSGELGVSLRDLTTRMRKAAGDPAVKAVVMLVDGHGAGRAQIEEIRQAMRHLQKAGKDIYVHSDSLDMHDYLLVSGASHLSVVPTADLWVNGLYGEAFYLRGLLNKLGVEPDFLTCGAYKSAAEIFMREGPSPEADRMQNWLLDSVYDTSVALIAEGRKTTPAKVKEWIDNGPYTAASAKKAGLVDAIEHRQEFEAGLKKKFGDKVVFDKKYGRKKAPELDLSSPFAFFKIWGDLLNEAQKKKSTRPAVGIVYVEGGIALGSSQPSPFGSAGGAMSSDIRRALNQAAKDDSIKAVVLRVNSPGGSAVASEIILDATRRVKAKKPFVVSMGDVAGSGGYYVACGSDVIFADATTITGSIGVVGGKLATTKMWNKIGITWKPYQRGANAGLLSSGHVFTPAERQRIQSWMDEIYGVFKGHVTAIRGDRLKKPIDELAGGRVYTGKQALELGLVDKIGTLEDAIHYVADKARLTDYDVRVVPEPKNFLELILDEASGGKEDPHSLDRAEVALKKPSLNLVELALPLLRELDPVRSKAVLNSLRQLEQIHAETVMLLMPELFVAP